MHHVSILRNIDLIANVSFLCYSLFQSYDKCFLGSSETADANRVFCGQLGAIYVFSEALNPAQIFAIHQLGPGYKVSQHHLNNCCTVYSLSLYASMFGRQNLLAT